MKNCFNIAKFHNNLYTVVMDKNEDITYDRLKGLSEDDIKRIIKEISPGGITLFGEKHKLIDKKLKPYGWSFERYLNQFF